MRQFPHLSITQTPPGYFHCVSYVFGLQFPSGYYYIITGSQTWLSRAEQVQERLPVSGQGRTT